MPMSTAALPTLEEIEAVFFALAHEARRHIVLLLGHTGGELPSGYLAKLLGTEGERHPGARHYFDCGGVILAVLDPSQGGLTPTPGPKSLYFAVKDVDAVHARATELKALAPYKVHGDPAGTVKKRPWG